MDKMIPFNKPYVPEVSKKYVVEALESDHQQGDGPFTERASKLVSDLVGGGHVLLTPSCTHALEMASMLGNFGPGDEVILPSYTFTSAATAVTKFGATPVFVDIDPVTKGIDANQVADAITNKTVAISWVNYAGIAPDIEALQSISKTHNLLLIEDNAHGLGGSYKGRPLGSFGDFATQSFHATKNIQCGEGGALVINSPKFIERAEVIREKGTNRSKFVRGEVQKYQWMDQGSSYLLAEPLAAILCGQLESFDEIQRNRIHLWNSYFNGTNQIKSDHFIIMNESETNVAHMFYLHFKNETLAKNFQIALKNESIDSSFHYKALNDSVAGKMYSKTTEPLKYTIDASNNLLRLPMWYGLHEKEQEIKNIVRILKQLIER
jgi:dTDP-4-amino-4,6-dideoxygalactose transaminase